MWFLYICTHIVHLYIMVHVYMYIIHVYNTCMYIYTPLTRGHLYAVKPLIRGHLYTVKTSDQWTPLYSET